MTQNKRRAIIDLLHAGIKTHEELYAAKRRVAKKYKITMPQNSEILKTLGLFDSENSVNLRRLLRKRAVRTLSGIAPVAVLTKPWPCPGKCAYCPTEKDVPQSYLSNEPAVMRAIREGYDPFNQVQSRLRALEANGHEPTKIELIVIGGTWSSLPDNYKFWYIKECFRAANDFDKNQNAKISAGGGSASGGKNQNYNAKCKINKLREQLETEQKRNEKAKYKIIGITLETRPDYIDGKELWQMRELGCTRVELGVQAVDDKILKKNKRGHGVSAIADATKLLKDYGFKVTYHIMPGLPGATAGKDLKMYRQLFSDDRFQPDQIKFYPTVVTRGSLLYRWWRQGKYKPYSQKTLEDLIVKCKAATPNYVRIIRLIRDIPGESIVAGNLITNLRQVMQQRGVECKCIRCREVKGRAINKYQLRITNYNASGGREYFIEAVSKDGRTLYGFCRLRLPNKRIKSIFEVLNTSNTMMSCMAALVRELHVYGELVPIGRRKKVQHGGLGKKLMAEAEKIARENGYEEIAVIAGVGVRNYYRKLGYRLKETYMIKVL